MGRGAWSSYPPIRKHKGFSERASLVGQDHEGVAPRFTVTELDVDKLWVAALRCAQRINGSASNVH
jgi:hypothetical protein